MLYIVDDDSYDSYDLVNDIIVFAVSMINDDICEIIREKLKKHFLKSFLTYFLIHFELFFFFSFRIFRCFFYTHQSFF